TAFRSSIGQSWCSFVSEPPVVRVLMSPLATYRVQLHAGFTFDDAAAIVDYLADLGISHLYCSPVLQAAPGSTHGYDVVDHRRVLEAREVQLTREGGSFIVRYHEHEVPVSPRSLDDLVGRAAAACGSDELDSVAVALGRLPHASATDRESVRERHRDKEVLR